MSVLNSVVSGLKLVDNLGRVKDEFGNEISEKIDSVSESLKKAVSGDLGTVFDNLILNSEFALLIENSAISSVAHARIDIQKSWNRRRHHDGLSFFEPFIRVVPFDDDCICGGAQR